MATNKPPNELLILDDEEDWRECCVCYCRRPESSFITCDKCGAMLYCNEDCRLRDVNADDSKDSAYNHWGWCARYKAYMDRGPELCNLPFTFTKETTDRRFHQHHLAAFLKRHGVLGKGMWRWECSTSFNISHDAHRPKRKKCGTYTAVVEDKWMLPEGAAILQGKPLCPAPSMSSPLADWQQYYSFRGLPLHSPVAAVLTYALTLYYILTTRLLSDEPVLFQKLSAGGTIRIHLLGVEREVEMKETFLECSRLLPDCKLQIVMIGQRLSKSVNGFNWEMEGLSVSVCRGLYHELGLPSPHLAIGFNAGLPAYPSWPATLRKLKEQNIPAYFTDQSEYAYENVQSAISTFGIPAVSTVVVNPFRSPLRIVTREQNMPWFSNAFVFRLLYTSK